MSTRHNRWLAIGCATNCRDDCLVQQRISRLIALVALGTKYLAATPLWSKAVSTAPALTQLISTQSS